MYNRESITPVTHEVGILFHIFKQYAIQIKFLGQAVVLFGCEMLIKKACENIGQQRFVLHFYTGITSLHLAVLVAHFWCFKTL
jgi:hypothetical protein